MDYIYIKLLTQLGGVLPATVSQFSDSLDSDDSWSQKYLLRKIQEEIQTEWKAACEDDDISTAECMALVGVIEFIKLVL